MSLVAAWYTIVYKGEGLPSSSSIDSALLASGWQKEIYNNDSNRHIIHLRCRDCVLSTEMRPYWHTVGACPKETWWVARTSLLVVKPSARPTEDVGNGTHGKHETFLLTTSLRLRTMEKVMNEVSGELARVGRSRMWCGQPDWWCRRNPPQVSASTSISRNKRMDGCSLWIPEYSCLVPTHCLPNLGLNQSPRASNSLQNYCGKQGLPKPRSMFYVSKFCKISFFSILLNSFQSLRFWNFKGFIGFYGARNYQRRSQR